MGKGLPERLLSILVLLALLPAAPGVACLDGNAPDCCERSGAPTEPAPQAAVRAGSDCACCVVLDQVASEKASRASLSPAASLEAAISSMSVWVDAGVLPRALAPRARDTVLSSLRTVVLLI